MGCSGMGWGGVGWGGGFGWGGGKRDLIMEPVLCLYQISLGN